MQLIEKVTKKQEIDLDAGRENKLRSWLMTEVEDALSARTPLEEEWRESLRMYEGIPKQPVRNEPVENAPNIEVTLGAVSADSIYAQALDLLFTANPIVTCRAVRDDKRIVDACKHLQTYTNWGVANEFNLRPAAEQSLLDCVQLGTGAYVIPFVEHIKKGTANKTKWRGPRIFSWPIEDFLLPGGSYDDLQRSRWLGLRMWLTRSELEHRAKLRGWRIDKVKMAAAVDWVRARRESLGKTYSGSEVMGRYEIFDFHVNYDIDDDGIDEDLMVTWDRTSAEIVKVRFNPFDRRPSEAMRYQLRGHLFYGLGVLEMLKSYQEETTEIHNMRTLNMLIANTRLWKAKEGAVPDTMRIWPNKVLIVSNPDDLQGEQLGDVYPSSFTAEAATISLAERRVGTNDMSLPRPSQVLGSRTPGITALSLLQQVNRRFTPAFDAMRNGTAGAVIQCLYRYQEQLLAGDRKAEENILRVLGADEGRLVIDLLKDEHFDEAVAVEMTASSASVNREADRQSAIQLMSLLGSYYQRIIELAIIMTNPQVPEPVRRVAAKVSEAAAEAIERTVRTFDVIRDPSTFIVKLEENLGAEMGQVNQGGLNGAGQLFQLLGQLEESANGGARQRAIVGGGV